MELSTYIQQDTVKVKNLINLVPEKQNSGELNVQRAKIPFHEISAREQKLLQPQPEKTTQKPTSQQIRYWQGQSEKKLLVGGSRLMETKKDVQLNTSVYVENIGLGLPTHAKNITGTDWLTILLLLSLVLFASVKKSFPKYLKHLMQSVINYSTASRLYQEKNNSLFSAAMRLEVVFYLAFSVFIYQAATQFNISLPYHNIYIYLICLGVVLGYFMFKYIAYRFVGAVIEGSQETNEYLFNLSNFNRISGLFILPFVTLIAFNPFKRVDFVIIAGAIILILFYILLIRRGIGILLKKQFSIYYLFLYLCTLEFLPLLLIYKIVVV